MFSVTGTVVTKAVMGLEVITLRRHWITDPVAEVLFLDVAGGKTVSSSFESTLMQACQSLSCLCVGSMH